MPSPLAQRLTARSARGVDQPAAPGQADQLGRDGRVTAAVVALADRAGVLDVAADEGVDERRLADAAGAEEGDGAVAVRQRGERVEAGAGAAADGVDGHGQGDVLDRRERPRRRRR